MTFKYRIHLILVEDFCFEFLDLNNMSMNKKEKKNQLTLKKKIIMFNFNNFLEYAFNSKSDIYKQINSEV